MKHLNEYKVFESKEELEETRSDIQSMCYDITDDGKFGIAFGKKTISPARIQRMHSTGKMFTTRTTKSIYYVYIGLRNTRDYNGFDVSEIKDVVQRIRNYLGDRYVGASLLPVNHLAESERVDMRGHRLELFEDIQITNIYINYKL